MAGVGVLEPWIEKTREIPMVNDLKLQDYATGIACIMCKMLARLIIELARVKHEVERVGG